MKCLLALILAISALLEASPACGAAPRSITMDKSRIEEIRGLGFVEETTAGGFRLTEHRNWAGAERSNGEAMHSPSFTDGYKSNQTKAEFRRATYLPSVKAAELRYGLPRGLLDALIWTESRYNPFAVSTAGAVGLGQLMPKTALKLGVSNRYEPHSNIAGAARYLKQMLDRFSLIELALAAYNAGPKIVESTRKIPNNGETPGYVRSVMTRRSLGIDQ